MARPNFFIIGAPKCGTTTICVNLKRHPEVYLPAVKEPRYYLNQSFKDGAVQRGLPVIRTEKEYLSLFDNVAIEKAIGESSPTYLFCEDTPKLIHSDVPRAKIIAILRQPAERAYSAYNSARMFGAEKSRSFEEAFKCDMELTEAGAGRYYGHYCGRSYNESLARWFKLFDRERIKVYLYDDLKANPAELLKNICQFLEVDDVISRNPVLANSTGNPTRTPLGFLLKLSKTSQTKSMRTTVKRLAELIGAGSLLESSYYRVWNANIVKSEPIPPELKRKITGYFRADILKLQDLIERDLAHWLEV